MFVLGTKRSRSEEDIPEIPPDDPNFQSTLTERVKRRRRQAGSYREQEEDDNDDKSKTPSKSAKSKRRSGGNESESDDPDFIVVEDKKENVRSTPGRDKAKAEEMAQAMAEGKICSCFFGEAIFRYRTNFFLDCKLLNIMCGKKLFSTAIRKKREKRKQMNEIISTEEIVETNTYKRFASLIDGVLESAENIDPADLNVGECNYNVHALK